jgi:hypothetical protein
VNSFSIRFVDLVNVNLNFNLIMLLDSFNAYSFCPYPFSFGSCWLLGQDVGVSIFCLSHESK